ncbi:MAG: phenylalanine--tRNA ligase subunit beta [Streptosporangiaceae bacterium]|jgi:phenylalanyl-tRNA synthetase beta chain|nr:phenylalanine--tRNA ligase subunit beta [Actinomycetota bacterium]
MRLPLSWLLEYAAIESAAPDGVDPADVARKLTAAGLEVESVERVGYDISGIVVAEVVSVEELTEFRKPVRYCQVSTGDGQERHVICGAVNFSAGDRVPLAQPGATLPGGFEIGARKTYGKISEGMICSAAELAIGSDHSGILVLSPDAPLGADFVSYAGLRDDVLDVNVTPDKGYALSVRGVARELAIAYGCAFTDPADVGLPADVDTVSDKVYPASIEDPTACDRFVLREVRGMDPSRPTPLAMRVRLARAGQRSVSLAVDVTNYLMLETGQPLHAFDRDRLDGPIVVRRARPGEQLETLDHVVRALDPEDILITDSSGPISLAGTMGGVATEVSEKSRNLVIEAAHFSARGTARMSRRHRLGSEASARFERGVDYELQRRAAARAGTLLAALGGGTLVPGCTYAWADLPETKIVMAADYPDQVAGLVYGRGTVTTRLQQVGCTVAESSADPAAGDVATAEDDQAAADGGDDRGGSRDERGSLLARHMRQGGRHDRSAELLLVVPPSWRPDLTDPSDLAEEVIRLEGYETVPVRSPRAAAGRGLTDQQRLRRTIGRVLASTGFVEVLSQPFSSAADFERLLLPEGDPRRRAVTIANPLSDDEPLLRTTLLPGLLRVLARNVGRGFADVALYEAGLVFRPGPDAALTAPILPVDRGPAVAEVAQIEAALPHQPLRLGVVLAGDREQSGWWGDGRLAGWQDAIETARVVLGLSRVAFEVRADQHEPWHPGRCAALFVQAETGGEWLAGHAGELHPRVVQAFGLPPRTAAMELDLSVIETAAAPLGPVQAPVISPYPAATQDVALIVAQPVPAADVASALAAGAAAADDVLLEDLRLFDVYTGDQIGEGRKSLAYTLRFRAPDRTLTAEEASAARDAAVAEAARRTGAVLRGAS